MASVWYLEISSFAGIVPHAHHYRGRLVNSDTATKIDIDRPMTEKERIKENREAGFVCFTEGNMTGSFYSVDSLKKAAVDRFRCVAEEGDILLEGRLCVCDPQEPLCGPSEWISSALELWNCWEKIDGWGQIRRRKDDPKEAEALRISKEWDLLMLNFSDK